MCPRCGQPEPVSEPPFLAEIGKVYVGKVTSTVLFGAFVELAPGVEGLLHISELDHTQVKKTEDVVKKGDVIQVKLLEVDDKGRLRLSRKSLLPDARGFASDVRCNCGEVGVEDTRSTNWPPRIVDGRLRVPFVCAAGHLFIRDLDRK
jgi:ribosomal protein S1